MEDTSRKKKGAWSRDALEEKSQPDCCKGLNQKVSKISYHHISRWKIESHLGRRLLKNKSLLIESDVPYHNNSGVLMSQKLGQIMRKIIFLGFPWPSRGWDSRLLLQGEWVRELRPHREKKNLIFVIWLTSTYFIRILVRKSAAKFHWQRDSIRTEWTHFLPHPLN